VDEWNEDRELLAQERLYLERLDTELESAESELARCLEFQNFMH